MTSLTLQHTWFCSKTKQDNYIWYETSTDKLTRSQLTGHGIELLLFRMPNTREVSNIKQFNKLKSYKAEEEKRVNGKEDRNLKSGAAYSVDPKFEPVSWKGIDSSKPRKLAKTSGLVH